MTLLLIFAYAVFAAATLYFAVTPFLASREEQARAELLDEELKKIEQLVARKTVLLQALRELEFEHETSKIADEDYERFRKKMERQAVGVMRELDQIHGGRGWQQVIDREIAERLKAAGISKPEPGRSDEDSKKPDIVEEPEESERVEEPDVQEPEVVDEPDSGEEPESSQDERPVLTCEKCGDALEDDDKFCGQCGHPVAIISEDTFETEQSKEATA